MKTLAIEWGPDGIRANSIVPGPIEGTQGVKRLTIPKTLAMLRNAVPVRRLGAVDDIGRAAVFLSSEFASYVTGVMLPVDGGLTLGGSGMYNFAVQQFGGPESKLHQFR